MTYEHGPLHTFEVIWKSGHVETIQAHQVLFPSPLPELFGGPGKRDDRICFHGEIDGRWTLILSAPEDEISTVRNVTATERSGP